jgi:hypothetical protein
MTVTWKARKMVPGKDTLAVMAMHYGISTGTITEIVLEAGADVIREDGFRGSVTMVDTKSRLDGTLRSRNRKVAGWSDGQVGVNPETTKLTRTAIRAVVSWKFKHDDEENGSAA